MAIKRTKKKSTKSTRTKKATKARKPAKRLAKKVAKKKARPVKKAKRPPAKRKAKPAAKASRPAVPQRFAPKPEPVDVKHLTLQDALDYAILIEDEAAERYAELAMQLEAHNTHEAAKFFHAMVGHERKHGEQLKTRRKLVSGDAPSRVTPAMIPEVEVADYDEARAFMTPHAALRVAMANERRAERFYVDACAEARLPEVRELFESLAAEEVEHQRWVREAMAKLPPEDRVDPEHFADEPVGH